MPDKKVKKKAEGNLTLFLVRKACADSVALIALTPESIEINRAVRKMVGLLTYLSPRTPSREAQNFAVTLLSEARRESQQRVLSPDFTAFPFNRAFFREPFPAANLRYFLFPRKKNVMAGRNRSGRKWCLCLDDRGVGCSIGNANSASFFALRLPFVSLDKMRFGITAQTSLALLHSPFISLYKIRCGSA